MRRFERAPSNGARSAWLESAKRCEWLEADGRGGFASGTVIGVRSRRYHALLLTATTPPTGRFVLVNGFDAWIESSAGVFPISAQHYAPGVVHPDGARRLQGFTNDPWPTWLYRLEDGTVLAQEIFLPSGLSAAVVRWRVVQTAGVAHEGAPRGDLRLSVRPFLSGRDYHSLHHENGVFRFTAEGGSGSWTFRPYDGVPEILMRANAAYDPAPEWYRRFQYEEERRRGLDFTEDLASPGIFTWSLASGDAVWVLAAGDAGGRFPVDPGEDPAVLVDRLARQERTRRGSFRSPLHRAADAYLVDRGEGRTIVAGYPWFTDWGRDTFIAMRGLCLAGGRLDDARSILLEWARAMSEGMLPNRFPDGPEPPEFHSVDASLWYVVAVHEYLRVSGGDEVHRPILETAADAILEGYARGTRHGIRADGDGLLAAGEPGISLTWMDARVDGRAITPRIGKPVEIQALWLNALAMGAPRSARWADLHARGLASFRERFWNEAGGHLHDVVDPDHRPGDSDPSLRPNQILAVGGLPFPLIEGEKARRVVDLVEERLVTEIGLRSLGPGEPGYTGRYEGGPSRRDGAYHQGTVWPWLIGPFVEAWVRVRGGTKDAKREAMERFVTPLLAHLDDAGLGHLSEVADGDPPHRPGGCPFQAWSLGELMRLTLDVLAPDPPPDTC